MDVERKKGKKGKGKSPGGPKRRQSGGRRKTEGLQALVGDRLSVSEPEDGQPYNDEWMTEDEEEPDQFSGVMESIVKIYCRHTEPNFSLPWTMRRQGASVSSGFVIDNRRILTNAHSVEYFSQVKVKRRGSDTKFIAEVLAVGVECDIALLTVTDPEFWEGIVPLRFGPLPRLQEVCSVIGYPIGGENISVTSGVVSRIEVTSYEHGSAELLAVQIDAAINAGNSGGPAFNRRGRCIGIAFQSLVGEDVENIGYVIPYPVVARFLADYDRNGRYTGFPTIGFDWQRMESPALRASLRMTPRQKGVLVKAVHPLHAAASILRRGDVVMGFDGIPIANDGTIPFRNGESILFSYLVSEKFHGDTIHLSVFRDGAEQVIPLTLAAPNKLIPLYSDSLPPPYFIVAGLVFVPCSESYLKSEYGADYDFDAPVRILEKMLYGHKSSPDDQIIVLSQVLAAPVNVGYEDLSNLQLIRFNGVPVHNLRHLVQLVSTCTDQYFRFEMDEDEIVIIDSRHANEQLPSLLATHSIPADRSVNLRF
eukprot:Opistho-2@8799